MPNNIYNNGSEVWFDLRSDVIRSIAFIYDGSSITWVRYDGPGQMTAIGSTGNSEGFKDEIFAKNFGYSLKDAKPQTKPLTISSPVQK